MKSMGTSTMPQAMAKSFIRWMLKPKVLINLLMASAVANLANSAGCTLSGPSTIHDLEPLICTGLKIVAKSRKSRNP